MDDIAAIATPAGKGGVAIIRISGGGSLNIARAMFDKNCPFEHAKMYAGKILLDGAEDFGYAVYFKAPHSFTGEDIVEFHIHGGRALALAALKKALSLGARAAEAGEFSRRAFLNGKLNLSSAEGMADMINAESGAYARAGSMQYFGVLNKKVGVLQDKLKDIMAAIAANVDYPEEDLDGLDLKKIADGLNALAAESRKLSETYRLGSKIKNGVTVAIYGAPNVGKSSLLNAILGYDRAIVSSEAGTTRDLVEGCAEIDGVKFIFTDTAGVREVESGVEKLGIERAESAAKSADIVLAVTDDGTFLDLPAGECVRVFNKCDILTPKGEYDIALSAKTGEGIGELEKLLLKKCLIPLAADEACVLDERHYYCLKRAAEAISSASEALYIGIPLDAVTVDLREGWEALGEITGETASEEIINEVFAKFCVGK